MAVQEGIILNALLNKNNVTTRRVNQPINGSSPPLIYALATGDYLTIARLLKYGADIRSSVQGIDSLNHIAAEPKILALLVNCTLDDELEEIGRARRDLSAEELKSSRLALATEIFRD